MTRCKICRTEFTRRSLSHKLCGKEECAIAWGLKEREKRLAKVAKEERAKTKLAKQQLDPPKVWAKKAEAVVNKYVRLRDAQEGCISCDKGPYWDGQWHASHFKSVGSNSALRFNLWNIHKSCSVCNNWKSGNIGAYRPRLIEKIGLDRVEWLENHPRSRDYDIEYLQRLIKVFNKKINRITKRRKYDEAA